MFGPNIKCQNTGGEAFSKHVRAKPAAATEVCTHQNILAIEDGWFAKK